MAATLYDICLQTVAKTLPPSLASSCSLPEHICEEVSKYHILSSKSYCATATVTLHTAHKPLSQAHLGHIPNLQIIDCEYLSEFVTVSDRLLGLETYLDLSVADDTYTVEFQDEDALSTQQILDFIGLIAGRDLQLEDLAQITIRVRSMVTVGNKFYSLEHEYRAPTSHLRNALKLFRSTVWPSESNALADPSSELHLLSSNCIGCVSDLTDSVDLCIL